MTHSRTEVTHSGTELTLSRTNMTVSGTDMPLSGTKMSHSRTGMTLSCTELYNISLKHPLKEVRNNIYYSLKTVIMIIWDFKKVLKMRGIVKPVAWLRSLGISRRLASKIANNKIDKISLYHLELLCEALKCTPHDFMVWKPRKAQADDKRHSLRCLLPDKRGTRVVNWLKKYTVDEIRKLEEWLQKRRDEDKEED